MQLPASFKFKDNQWNDGENNKIKAKIEYTFKGTVDVNGAFAKDLKGKLDVAILSVPLNTIPIGRMTKTETVTIFKNFIVLVNDSILSKIKYLLPE